MPDVIPVTSHDFALRVEEAALRFARAGRIERGEDAIAPEKGVEPGGIHVGSSEPTVRADPVDNGQDGVGHVNCGEDALALHEAMCVAVRVISTLPRSRAYYSRWLQCWSRRARRSW